jgi:hypothetical protein
VIARLGPVAVAAVVGLFGCSPAVVPRSEFLRRATAVCANTNDRLADLAAPRRSGRSRPALVAGYVDAYVAEVRQEVVDLRLIGYSPGERRMWERAYDDLDAALTAIERDPLSFRVATIAQAEAPLARAGLTACHP